MKKVILSVALVLGMGTTMHLHAQDVENYRVKIDSVKCVEYSAYLKSHGTDYQYSVEECCKHLVDSTRTRIEDIIWYNRLSETTMQRFWVADDKKSEVISWCKIKNFRYLVIEQECDFLCNQEFYLPECWDLFIYDYCKLLLTQEKLINRLLDEEDDHSCTLFSNERCTDHGDYRKNVELIDTLCNHLWNDHDSDLPSLDGYEKETIDKLELHLNLQ